MSRRGRPSSGCYDEDIYERDLYPTGGRRERYLEDDRDYRRRHPPATLVREVDERVRVRDRSVPDYFRQPAKDDGAMVVKTREREDVELRSREKPKGVEKESDAAANRRETSTREKRSRKKADREESLNRGENRGRRSSERDEPSSNKREQSLPPPWQDKVIWGGEEEEEEERSRRRWDERDKERSGALVRRRDRSVSSWDSERDERAFRQSSRDRSREREWERNEFRRHSSPRARSRSRYRIDERDEIIIRREEREGRRGRGVERNEIAFRRREERSTSPESASSPERPVIVAPPIHQDIITHHRHIDHGQYITTKFITH